MWQTKVFSDNLEMSIILTRFCVELSQNNCNKENSTIGTTYFRPRKKL